MQRLCTILAVLAVLWLCGPADRASGATLASLVAGGTLETALLKFDSFTYTGFAGGPTAAAINVTPVTFAADLQGLTFDGTFSSTTFAQATIGYRVTGKSGSTIDSASLAGNPMAGAGQFMFVDQAFSGGLSPLSIFSQSGTTSTTDSNTFSPRSGATATTLLRFNGAVGSPSTLSSVEQLYGAATEHGADFDENGVVDGRDFLTWQRNLGLTGAMTIQGDANGDMLVDEQDLEIWLGSYGPAAIQPIPEPGAAALAAAAACTLMRLVGRRRR